MKNSSVVDDYNTVAVPIYETETDGAIIANPIFHRPYDKLHSRCIEYPFAASKLGESQRILDVGTGKADPLWITWLERLPIEVYATDYEAPPVNFRNIHFKKSDVRHLPFPNEYFDRIFAVSVVEHIGLESPQVNDSVAPKVSADGDVTAVRELVRVLRSERELVLTVPFGLTEGLILGDSARSYTIQSIKKFENVVEIVSMDYYEYQHSQQHKLFDEYPDRNRGRYLATVLGRVIFRKLGKVFHGASKNSERKMDNGESTDRSRIPGDQNIATKPGAVVWRRVPVRNARAKNRHHVEGVVCMVLRKR